MPKNLTLYHYWRSTSSWRVRWALELKGLKPAFVHVDLVNGESESPQHLARHPLGYVPVLDVDGRKLLESVAIIEWLEENIPGPQLYAGDSFTRAHIRMLVELINADTQPIQNPTVTEKHSSDAALKKEWNQYFISRGLAAFEKLVASRAGRHCVGDQITAADLFLIPQCYNAVRFDVDLAQFPVVQRLNAAALSTPQAIASHPDRFKP